MKKRKKKIITKERNVTENEKRNKEENDIHKLTSHHLFSYRSNDRTLTCYQFTSVEGKEFMNWEAKE